jgi:hypothetical protein
MSHENGEKPEKSEKQKFGFLEIVKANAFHFSQSTPLLAIPFIFEPGRPYTERSIIFLYLINITSFFEYRVSFRSQFALQLFVSVSIVRSKTFLT